MVKKIAFSLDVSSINNAIKEVERYTKWANAKKRELAERLAKIGMTEASIRFMGGWTEGNTNVSVTVEEIEGGFKVVASGTDVCFLEFGTGDAAGRGYTDIPPEINVAPGSWSSEHAKQYSEKGYWYFNREKFTETPPLMGMFYAGKKIREEIATIAREVFEK